MPQPRAGFGGGRGGGQQQRQQLPVWPDTGQEGSRWIGERPSEEAFANWWTNNVPIHDELNAADYIGGVVLIEQTERQKRVVVQREGEQEKRELVQGQRLVFTPYAKVDVRVRYFWDLMAKHPDWLGVIEPVPVPSIERQGLTNDYLPDGIFRHAVEGDKGWVSYIASTARVRVFDRNMVRIVEWEDLRTGEPRYSYVGQTIIDAMPETKLVPALDTYGNPDPFAIMKAKTGAVGRALGQAGMLVIPGSGIATAEDVQEAVAAEAAPRTPSPSATVAALPTIPGDGAPPEGEPPAEQVPGTPGAEGGPPSDVPTGADTPAQAAEQDEASLRASLVQTLVDLRARSPQGYDEFKTWFESPRSEGGRELGALSSATIEGLTDPMLRGIVRRAERALEEAPAAAEDSSSNEPTPDAGGQNDGEMTTKTPTDAPTDAPKSAESSTEPGEPAQVSLEPPS